MEFIRITIYDLVMRYKIIISPCFLFFLYACSGNLPGSVKDTTLKPADSAAFQKSIATKRESGLKTIHVFVALCDNKYQGIVPVPARIGNGQDAATNLYWGAAFGVKTFFNKSSEWKLIEIKKNPAANILAYVGHDGLMDFSLSNEFEKQNDEDRKAIMLACISKKYFSSLIKSTGAEPLLWSTGLMAPEAYILHDAVNKWIDSGDQLT